MDFVALTSTITIMDLDHTPNNLQEPQMGAADGLTSPCI
jgi:hypothetical protein